MSQSKRMRKHLACQGRPKCGRQLSRPSLAVANQANMELTEDLSEVKCRHCLRAAGLLAPLRGRTIIDPEDQIDDEEIRESAEEEVKQELEEENEDVS